MKRFTTTLAALLLLAAGAQAQFLNRPTSAGFGSGGSPGGSALGGGIGSAPTSGGFSPYLNLNRGGNTAALNYYGIIRPQMNFQSSLQSLSQQQQQTAGMMQDDPLMPGIVVGTRPRFLNTSGYFLNINGGTTPGMTGGIAPGPGGQTQSGFGAGMQSTATGSGLGAGTGSSGLGTSPGGRTGSRGPMR
jgi:hypothetical protein